MKQIILCFMAFGFFCSPLQATTEMEEDMNAIVKSMTTMQDEMKQQFLTMFAQQAIENGEKTMDCDELVAKIGQAFDSPEFFKKFYSFFEETFTPEEIKKLRVVYEDATYIKMQKNIMQYSQAYMGAVTETINSLLETYGEDKPRQLEKAETKVVEVVTDSFEKEVEQVSGPVIVDVYANWCPPCKKMKPIFDELSCEFSKIKFVKIDCDKAQEIAKRYKIQSLPTFIFFKDGKEVGRNTGFTEKKNFEEKIVDFFG